MAVPLECFQLVFSFGTACSAPIFAVLQTQLLPASWAFYLSFLDV